MSLTFDDNFLSYQFKFMTVDFTEKFAKNH